MRFVFRSRTRSFLFKSPRVALLTVCSVIVGSRAPAQSARAQPVPVQFRTVQSVPLQFVQMPTAPTAQPAGALTIRAEGKSITLSAVALAKLSRRELRILAKSGNDSATVSGVVLWDLLQAAGVPAPEASGRQRAAMYVRLIGSDGQNAMLGLADVGPGFSRRIILVADRRDGKVLDAVEGPWRVFIADDQRHAR